MLYYVYKITNTVNGKFYIGKRGHKDPYSDSYMGSGRQIQSAIKKYGKDKFIKEILQVFETNDKAAELEKSLVTREIIETAQCYNMHEGGHGGFGHINNVPPEKRVNVIALKEKVESGEIEVGGTKNWSAESWERVRYYGWNARRARGEVLAQNTWRDLTLEQREQRKKKISDGVSGENNWAHGTHIYIDSEYNGSLPPTTVLNKQRYKDGSQPNGWITVREWKNNRKNKKNNAYGRHWYNDGSTNYYLYPTDEKCKDLRRGRLGKIGKPFRVIQG